MSSNEDVSWQQTGPFLRSNKKKEIRDQNLIVYTRMQKRVLESEACIPEEEIEISVPEMFQLFSSQAGRLSVGPTIKPKGTVRQPYLRLLERDLDWPEKPNFYHDTCRNIENKFEKITLHQVTVEQLFRDRNLKFSVEGLRTITESVKVFDANNCPLLYYCKGALKWPFAKDRDAIKEGETTLNDLVHKYIPPEPKKLDERHLGVVHEEGHGVYHLALWHATGHGYCIKEKDTHNGGLISADIAAISATKMNVVAEFYVAFSPVSQAVGALFQIIDPICYEKFHKLYHDIADKSALRWLRTTKQNYFLGMAILSGLCCKPHQDKNDAINGWAVDLAFGDFDGGYLEVPQLGMQFALKRGDVIYIRLALLQYSVSMVTRGHRFGANFFSHKSMME